MKTAWKLAFVPLVVVMLSGFATESDSMKVVHEALRTDKRELVAKNLHLTEEEAKAFWPLYDRYQTEMLHAQARLFAVVSEHIETLETLDDERARELVDLYFEAENDRVRVRRSYVEPMSKVLPGRKLARFFQIENKIDAVVRYESATRIPMVSAD